MIFDFVVNLLLMVFGDVRLGKMMLLCYIICIVCEYFIVDWVVFIVLDCWLYLVDELLFFDNEYIVNIDWIILVMFGLVNFIEVCWLLVGMFVVELFYWIFVGYIYYLIIDDVD